jgi:hypothetical protein
VSLSVLAIEQLSVGSVTYVIESPRPSSTPVAPTAPAEAPDPDPVPTGVATQDVSRSDDPPTPGRDRPVVTRVQPPQAPPTLAATGARTGALALVGVLAVLAGSALVVVGRPRRAVGPSS